MCRKCGLPNYATVLSESRTLLCDPQPYKQAIENVGFYHEAEERATVIESDHRHHDTANIQTQPRGSAPMFAQ